MGKRPRFDRHSGAEIPVHPALEAPIPRGRPKPPIEPLTARQADYISSIKRKKATFGVGPAGTGKTYLAARMAAEGFLERSIRKIVLTRPAVESGRSIGYLPGELEEKMAPYMASYGPGFRDGFGEGHFEYMLAKRQIEIVPLNFMQGRSFDEPMMVLFDEAENASAAEMKMFLTRLGENAKAIIDGDVAQSVLRGPNALEDAASRLFGDPDVGVVRFDRNDIVRSGFVRRVLDAYDDAEPENVLPDFIVRG